MRAIITHNTEKNGIEVKFPTKPADHTLNALKALGFKWSKFGGVWWATHNADRWTKVHTLLGDEIETDSSYAKPERTEKVGREFSERTEKNSSMELPFLQHIKAYMQYRSLLPDHKDTYLRHKPQDLKVDTLMDKEGNVILHQHGKMETDPYYSGSGSLDYKEYHKWYRVSKAGKVEAFEPGKLNYSSSEVYKFGPNVYGVPDRESAKALSTGADLRQVWFRPSDKNGVDKYISNGKQVDANVRDLQALGLEVRSAKGFRFGVIFKVPEGGKLPERITASGESDFTQFMIPYRIHVPNQWRKPYFNLDNYSRGGGYKDGNYLEGAREKLRSDLIEVEVLLGKLEVAVSKYFDGMQDMYEYISEDKLVWIVPQNGLNDYHLGSEKPWHNAKNRISWGNVYLRYTGKAAPAYIDLSAGVPTLEEQSGRSTAPVAPADPLKVADKYIALANTLQTESGQKKVELEKALRNTPKRNREWNSKNIEADMLADKAMYYRAIGEAIKAGTLPDILKGITPIRKNNDLRLFIFGLKPGGGYYEAYRDDRPDYKRYNIDSPNQLKTLLEDAGKIGLKSYHEIEQAYTALNELVSSSEHATSRVDNAIFEMQQHLRAFGGAESREKMIERQSKLNRLIDSWRFTNQQGFFPTPREIAMELVKTATIKPGNTILEPEGGLGDIAEVIREMYPNNPLTVCEKMMSLREILDLKGFTLTSENDFLQVKEKFNRIIMNPPFENGQDIDHVRHAHSLLKPGGWVVAIMSEGSFFRTDRKATAFREWLEEIGAWDKKLPEGSFKNAFRSTGVATRLVVMEKEGIERRPANKDKMANLSQAAKGLSERRVSRHIAALSKPKRKQSGRRATGRLKLKAKSLWLQLSEL